MSTREMQATTPAAYGRVLQNWEKRAELRKASEVRDSIDVQGCLNSLFEILELAKTCELEELERLKFQASIIQSVLKKALPDLKAIEITEHSFKHNRLTIDLSGIQRTPLANDEQNAE